MIRVCMVCCPENNSDSLPYAKYRYMYQSYEMTNTLRHMARGFVRMLPFFTCINLLVRLLSFNFCTFVCVFIVLLSFLPLQIFQFYYISHMYRDKFHISLSFCIVRTQTNVYYKCMVRMLCFSRFLTQMSRGLLFLVASALNSQVISINSTNDICCYSQSHFNFLLCYLNFSNKQRVKFNVVLCTP